MCHIIHTNHKLFQNNLYQNAKFSYKFNFSKCNLEILFKWWHLDDYLEKRNLTVEQIVGDGFCFLISILNGLDKDYGIKITLEDFKHNIITYLLGNVDKYVDYHQEPEKFEESIATMKDIILSDKMDFLKNCNYIDDIVNVLMQVVADCLDVNINVFQRKGNYIKKIQICGRPNSKDIYVKFTWNPQNEKGNHYDSTIRSLKLPSPKPLYSDVVKKTHEKRDRTQPHHH